MNDVMPFAVHAAQEQWLCAIAVRELGTAIDTLDAAGAALMPVLADSQWQSRGVRALHERIRGIAERTAGEATAIRLRLWEVEAVPTS